MPILYTENVYSFYLLQTSITVPQVVAETGENASTPSSDTSVPVFKVTPANTARDVSVGINASCFSVLTLETIYYSPPDTNLRRPLNYIFFLKRFTFIDTSVDIAQCK